MGAGEETMRPTMLIAAVLLSACQPKPSASDVCKKLEAAGVATAGSCKQDKPLALAARAKEKYVFDLASVPGKTGQVLTHASAEDYKATVDGFTAAAALAGPHRYGSEKALVFVQLNDKASLDVGNKAKAVVDGL
jgi:hypothetical protein